MGMLVDFSGIRRERFVETGTQKGNSLAEAAKVFPECMSIEQSDWMYKAACERFKDTPNVKLFHGHSPRILPLILDATIPTTFWLDAHYFSDASSLCFTGGECPLLEEVQAIAAIEWQTKPIILIDDMWMFDDALPPPDLKWPMSFWRSNEVENITYHKSQWPRIEQIEEVLAGYKRSLRCEGVYQYEGV